jgi:dihydrofolate reductase
MKTILRATLSADGDYAQATPDNPPRPEALRDFAEHAKAHGNFIVGRKTFEGFAANGPNPEFADLNIVVVSSQPVLVSGVNWTTTPSLALRHLEERGHKTALLSGGESYTMRSLPMAS